MLEIAEYCCFDVKVLRLVHEHGCRHKELFFQDRFAQRQRIEVDWTHLDRESDGLIPGSKEMPVVAGTQQSLALPVRCGER